MSHEYPTPSMQGSTESPYSVWEQLLGPGANLGVQTGPVVSVPQPMQPCERITGQPVVDVQDILAAQQHEAPPQTAPLRATIVQDGGYRTGFGEEARREYAPPKTNLSAWSARSHEYRPTDIAYGLDAPESTVCVADFSTGLPDQEIHFSPVKPGTIKSEAAVLKRAHEVALEGLVAASRKYRAALDARDSVAMEEARDDRDYHAACAQKLARSWQMLEVTPMHVANRRRSAGYLNEEETQPYERGVSPPAVRPVYGAPSASTAMPEHLLQLGREYGLDRPKQYGLPEDEEDGISPAAKRNFRRLGYLLLHAQS